MAEKVHIRGRVVIFPGNADRERPFDAQILSVSGVAGLPANVVKEIGEEVPVAIEVRSDDAELEIEVKGRFSKMTDINGSFAAIDFTLTPEQESKMKTYISLHGSTPKAFIRRTVRYPSFLWTKTIPLRASFIRPGADEDGPQETCQFINISPGGVLVTPDDMGAPPMKPGDQFDLFITNADISSQKIAVRAQVRWIRESSPDGTQIKAQYGIQFLFLLTEAGVTLSELIAKISHLLSASKPDQSAPQQSS